MDRFTLWSSTDEFSKFIHENTMLKNEAVEFKYLPESDASKPKFFHRLPTHIKNIQYLDSPDLIIELNSKPILSVEISTEAGTGHNAFQRFARIAAAVENNVPCIYIYPEAVKIFRKNTNARWDVLNPLIFYALEKLSRIFPDAPALFYYFPSYYRDEPDSDLISRANRGLRTQINSALPIIDQEMKHMLECINEIILHFKEKKTSTLVSEPNVSSRISFMQQEYFSKGGSAPPNKKMSPITSTIKVPSSCIIDYIKKVKKGVPSGDYFRNTVWDERKETIIYKIDASYRGDPYPGALAALDYMLARTGKTYEDRNFNLVLAWGNVSYDNLTNTLSIDFGKDTKGEYKDQSIETLFSKVKRNNAKNDVLDKEYSQLDFEQLPRYFMHMRFGTTFSKPKETRVYSYFSDAILFPDGAVWREG